MRDTRPTVTFPAVEHHPSPPLTSAKLYSMVMQINKIDECSFIYRELYKDFSIFFYLIGCCALCLTAVCLLNMPAKSYHYQQHIFVAF